jgi:uncharacterized membrane protein
MPPVRLERLAKLAFDQIRQASSTTPAVLIRQLEVIRRLVPRFPDACRQALSDQAEAILETASAGTSFCGVLNVGAGAVQRFWYGWKM